MFQIETPIYIFQLFVYNFSNKLPLLKRILASSAYGQVYNITMPQTFTFVIFQMEHPVKDPLKE